MDEDKKDFKENKRGFDWIVLIPIIICLISSICSYYSAKSSNDAAKESSSASKKIADIQESTLEFNKDLKYAEVVFKTYVEVIPNLGKYKNEDEKNISFCALYSIAHNFPAKDESVKRETMKSIVELGLTIVPTDKKIQFLQRHVYDRYYPKDVDYQLQMSAFSGDKNMQIIDTKSETFPIDNLGILNTIKGNSTNIPIEGWLYSGHYYPKDKKSQYSKIIKQFDLKEICEKNVNKDKTVINYKENNKEIIGNAYIRKMYPCEIQGKRVWSDTIDFVKTGDKVNILALYLDRPTGSGSEKPYVIWTKITR
ncbi:MAG: hypothetical protein AB2L14_11900 [Candidatus Xenobiia bacterium LiM19]